MSGGKVAERLESESLDSLLESGENQIPGFTPHFLPRIARIRRIFVNFFVKFVAKVAKEKNARVQ
jgi:hypothetical protein